MTLRARLTLGFTLLLAAPLALGVALLVAGLPAPAPEVAAIAVRDTIAADCRHLQVTADGLALTAAARGESLLVTPPDAAGPWAVCGAQPIPGGVPRGLAARAEVRDGAGNLTGYAYAVQPLDDAYLSRLSAAAGRPVSLSGQAVPDGSGHPLPLVIEEPKPADDAGWRPATVAGLVAVLVAVIVAAALAWWLAGLIIRPLAAVLQAVERATTGDLELGPRPESAGAARDATARDETGRDETGRIASAVDRLIGALTEAQRLSVTDPLTGLGNLRSLRESLRREVERAGRFGRTLGVLVLDLDHFKAVNDQHGHRAGDEVLVELGARIRGIVREVDLAFRQGGEEFVLLLPETAVPGCLTLARRLTRAVREQPFPLPHGEVSVTVSIGVAVYPQHGRTGGEVLDAADAALYRAKAAGRDTYRLPAGGLPGQRPPNGHSVNGVGDGTPAASGRSGG